MLIFSQTSSRPPLKGENWRLYFTLLVFGLLSVIRQNILKENDFVCKNKITCFKIA